LVEETMYIDEATIIETTKQVSGSLFAFLGKREGHATAAALLDMLQSEHHLSPTLARHVIWLMMEEGRLGLGKNLELEVVNQCRDPE